MSPKTTRPVQPWLDLRNGAPMQDKRGARDFDLLCARPLNLRGSHANLVDHAVVGPPPCRALCGAVRHVVDDSDPDAAAAFC